MRNAEFGIAEERRKAGTLISGFCSWVLAFLRDHTRTGRAACRARSTADFIARMGIVEEEADETLFWLEFLEESELVAAAKLTAIKEEANELIAITVASIKTARRNRAADSVFRIPHSALA